MKTLYEWACRLPRAQCAGDGRSLSEYRSGCRSVAEFESLADDLINERLMANEQEDACDVA
jgi:hypothetical protein